jgi:hypothetical protein
MGDDYICYRKRTSSAPTALCTQDRSGCSSAATETCQAAVAVLAAVLQAAHSGQEGACVEVSGICNEHAQITAAC